MSLDRTFCCGTFLGTFHIGKVKLPFKVSFLVQLTYNGKPDAGGDLRPHLANVGLLIDLNTFCH